MATIIPSGKSDLFESSLEEFKDKYVKTAMAAAYDKIPIIEVDAEVEDKTAMEACPCPGKKSPVKKEEDLKITEGDEPDTKDSKKAPCKSEKIKKHVSLATLTDEQKEKLEEYWSGIFPDTDFAKSLAKDY